MLTSSGSFFFLRVVAESLPPTLAAFFLFLAGFGCQNYISGYI